MPACFSEQSIERKKGRITSKDIEMWLILAIDQTHLPFLGVHTIDAEDARPGLPHGASTKLDGRLSNKPQKIEPLESMFPSSQRD